MKPEDLTIQDTLFGQTALHSAASDFNNENVESVRELIPFIRSKDLSIRDMNGKTALHLASDRGHGDIMVLLLKHKADPCLVINDEDSSSESKNALKKYEEICKSECGYHFDDGQKDWVENECSVVGESSVDQHHSEL